MAEGGRINFPPGKKKGRDDEEDFPSGGKHYPKGKMGKAERRASLQAKREFGGIPPSEIAVPVEAPVSEPVVEQAPIVEEIPTESAEVPPVAAAEPEAEAAPQEPAPAEAAAPVVEPATEPATQEAPLGKEKKTKESEPVPPELSAIYGDKVPPVVLETFKKIRNAETRASFLELKAAEEKQRVARRAEKKQKPAGQEGKKKVKKPKPEKKPAQAAAPKTEAAPVAEPALEIPPIARVLEGLEREAIDKNIAAAHGEIIESPLILNTADAAQERILRGKLEEYEGRLKAESHIPPEGKQDTIYKHAILKQLLENGEISVFALEENLRKQYGSSFNPEDFTNAVGVIEDYVKTGGQSVVGGTGLHQGEIIEGEVLSRNAVISQEGREIPFGPHSVPNNENPEEIALNTDDVPEYIRESLEAGETRAGWKSKLRELVGKFGEGVSERFTRSRNYLDERAKELDAKAEMSGLEKWTRNIGEKYNKLSTIHKLGIGATLGVGTAVGAAFSLPLALTGVAGLVLQRAAGAAGMFVSIEKKLQEKRVQESYQWMAVKERAALDALLYTAVMGTAISKGLEVARDYELVEKTREWLGSMFGHQAHPPVVSESVTAATKESVGAAFPPSGAAASPELPKSVRGFQAQVREIDNAILKAQGAPIAAAEVHGPAVIPSAPGLPVENAPMQAEAITAPEPTQPEALITSEPSQPEVSSSIPEELPPPQPEAPASSPEVAPPAVPEILEGQNVDIDDETRRKALEFVAPSSPEAPSVEAVPANEPAPFETPSSPTETPSAPVEAPQVPAEIAPSVEAPAAPELPPLQEVPLPEQQPIQAVDVTAGVERPPESIDASIQPEAPSVSAPEAQSIVNSFNVEVSTVEPHVYADSAAEHMFVYGGSPEKQAGMILKYLIENPDKTIYGTDDKGLYRIPWHLVDGKAVPGTPVQTTGIFGFFKSFMGAPKPEEFAKIIKYP